MRIQIIIALLLCLNLISLFWEIPYSHNWYWELIMGLCGIVYLGYLIVHRRAMKADE
ncbi:hypothetical protein [Periweissella fabalis]